LSFFLISFFTGGFLTFFFGFSLSSLSSLSSSSSLSSAFFLALPFVAFGFFAPFFFRFFFPSFLFARFSRKSSTIFFSFLSFLLFLSFLSFFLISFFTGGFLTFFFGFSLSSLSSLSSSSSLSSAFFLPLPFVAFGFFAPFFFFFFGPAFFFARSSRKSSTIFFFASVNFWNLSELLKAATLASNSFFDFSASLFKRSFVAASAAAQALPIRPAMMSTFTPGFSLMRPGRTSSPKSMKQVLALPVGASYCFSRSRTFFFMSWEPGPFAFMGFEDFPASAFFFRAAASFAR